MIGHKVVDKKVEYLFYLKYFLLDFFLKVIMVLSSTPTLALAAKGVGLGRVASNLMDPVSVISDFVHSGCLLIGGSFLFASIVKYAEHKKSPTMVPISTVIFLLIAGLVLVSLPLVSYVTSNGVPYSIIKR